MRMSSILLCTVLIVVAADALAYAQVPESRGRIPPPERSEFFKTIDLSIRGKLDSARACTNAEKGMRLAIQLTGDRETYRIEREIKGGYNLEDYAAWAMKFLSKCCSPEKMKPLVEELVRAEVAAAKAEEPGLAVAYFAAADFYLTRCADTGRAEHFFDLAVQAIPKVRYENTHSIIPEKFARCLMPYEQLLAAQPQKAKKHTAIRFLRIQQQAKHINNVGNRYLMDVTGPPAETGLYDYEVHKAVEAYTRAIELIPRWTEPYKGRARAYELLGQHDLAKKDVAAAKKLE